MVTQTAETISTFFNEKKLISPKEQQKCRYGLEIIISTILGFSAIILTGGIVGKWEVAIAYLMCIVPIRMYTGGYHASTYLRCNTVFTIIFVINLVLYQVVILHGWENILWWITAFSVLPIMKYVPIENKNKKMTIEKRIKCRKISLVLYFLYYALATLLLSLGSELGNLILLVLNTVTILVWEVKISEKIKSQNVRMYC